MSQTAAGILNEQYDIAMTLVGSKETISTDLPDTDVILLDILIDNSENAKAVLTVFITSAVYKIR